MSEPPALPRPPRRLNVQALLSRLSPTARIALATGTLFPKAARGTEERERD